MGDTVENIEYNIVTKGVNETVYDFSRVRDAAQKISVDAEAAGSKSSGAFKGLGLVAKSLGHEFGITGGMSKLLSHEVVDMASMLGKGALAFGVVGIAAMGAKMVYDHFSEATKKKREELEKSVSALWQEIDAHEKGKLKTLELAYAEKEYAEAKKKTLLVTLPDLIREENDALKEEEKNIKTTTLSFSDRLKNFGNIAAINEVIKKNQAEATVKVEEHRTSVKKLTEQYNALLGKGTKIDFFITDKKGLHEYTQLWINALSKNLTVQAEYDRQMVSLSKARGDSLDQQWKYEVIAFDAVTTAHIAALATQDERDAYYKSRQIERSTLTYNHEKQIDDLMIKNKQTLANETSQVFDDLYELSDKKQKAWFYAARGAAAAETFFSYQLAAANSVGKMGPFGIGMAAYFEALSYIKPALILATSLTGPSGGGGTSTPPSSPDSSHDWDTGGSGGNNSTINLHLNINGKSVTMNDIGSLTSDVVKYLYDNNGSVDGLTISVDRSA